MVNTLTNEIYACKKIDFTEESCQGIPGATLWDISSMKELGKYNH